VNRTFRAIRDPIFPRRSVHPSLDARSRHPRAGSASPAWDGAIHSRMAERPSRMAGDDIQLRVLWTIRLRNSGYMATKMYTKSVDKEDDLAESGCMGAPLDKRIAREYIHDQELKNSSRIRSGGPMRDRTGRAPGCETRPIVASRPSCAAAHASWSFVYIFLTNGTPFDAPNRSDPCAIP